MVALCCGNVLEEFIDVVKRFRMFPLAHAFYVDLLSLLVLYIQIFYSSTFFNIVSTCVQCFGANASTSDVTSYIRFEFRFTV